MDPDILDELIEKLRPEAQVISFGRLHDDARASFPFGRSTVDDSSEFDEVVAAYVQHHEIVANGKRLSRDEALYDGEQILRSVFRNEHGVEGARREGMSGSQRGGIRYVLDMLARGLKDKARRIYVRTVISEYLQTGDFDQCEDALGTLEEQLSAIWPEMSTKTRVEMALEIGEVLEGTAGLSGFLYKMASRQGR